jgi:hypothetical protein
MKTRKDIILNEYSFIKSKRDFPGKVRNFGHKNLLTGQ